MESEEKHKRPRRTKNLLGQNLYAEKEPSKDLQPEPSADSAREYVKARRVPAYCTGELIQVTDSKKEKALNTITKKILIAKNKPQSKISRCQGHSKKSKSGLNETAGKKNEIRKKLGPNVKYVRLMVKSERRRCVYESNHGQEDDVVSKTERVNIWRTSKRRMASGTKKQIAERIRSTWGKYAALPLD